MLQTREYFVCRRMAFLIGKKNLEKYINLTKQINKTALISFRKGVHGFNLLLKLLNPFHSVQQHRSRLSR